MQLTKRVKDPRKQRKRLYNAPAHLRHKFMAAPLSPELAASKGVKSLPVRKGDTVRVVRGDNIGFEGKISRIDLRRYRIFIDGLTREKVDGTNIFVSLHPSKVIIKNLKLDDKWRKAIVERKKELAASKKEKNVKKAVEKLDKNAANMKKEKVAKTKAVVQEKSSGKASRKKNSKAKPKITPKTKGGK